MHWGSLSRRGWRRWVGSPDRDFISNYAPPLLVLAVVFAALLLDYGFRESSLVPYDRGYARLNRRDVDGAIADFNKSLRRNPSDPASIFALGYAYHARGWLDEAQKQYERSGPVAADLAHFSFHNLGVILQQKGDLSGAETAYRRSLRVKPEALNSLVNLALIYAARGRSQAVLGLYQRFLEDNPRNETALLGAADAAEASRQKQLALQYYRSALLLNPANAAATERLRRLTGGR